MTDNYSELLKKLDSFIRKYYKNQLLKGLILCLSLLLALFLILALLEYFAYFNSLTRAVLFYSYLLTTIIVLIRLIIIPLFKLNKIGKIISYEQAAEIIGKYFTDVNDKLLNTLQLRQISISDITSTELIEASIDQKINKLTPIPFVSAIDLKINKKYLKFLLPPAIVILAILIASPAIVTEPSKRYFNYSEFFERQAPFQFVVLNKKFEVIQQQDFQIDVKLTGDDIPSEIFVVSNNNEYKLSKENIVLFHYTFKNIQKNIKFFLKADRYRSKEYELKVIPKPIILDFEVGIDYPDYTGKKDETVENSGDLSVPCGTKITWRLKTKDTQKIFFHFVDKNILIGSEKTEKFNYSQTFFQSENYTVIPQNQFVKNSDSLKYTINVIADSYPLIDLKEYRDSLYNSHLYFKGFIKDDYGFNKLLFKFRRSNPKNSENNEPELSQIVNINKFINQQDFYYYFDISLLNADPGETIEYYFEIWDNDGIKGSKATRSSKMVFKIPTTEEIQKQTEKNNEEIKDKVEQAIKDINQLQKQADDINQKLLDKKNLSWQERKQIEDLLTKQQQIQQNVEDLKEQLHENNIREQQFQKPDSNILKKQKQLEDLFNKLMTDEMKDLFKQMQEMLDKLDKNKINELLDKIKMSNKDLEKELDRNLEIFKQLEFEKKMTETIEKLKQLAEEQKNLSEKTKDENNNQKQLLEEQKKINEQFDDVKKDLKDLEQKNNELDPPKDLKNTDEKQNSIQQDLNNSKSNLENNKRKNASKSQQNAGEQMEELANELDKMQQEMQEEESAEDEQSLRAILENLIKVSLSQEDLIDKIRATNINDPKYLSIMDKQKELKDDLKMIEDSLLALSKRQAMIEPIINREISKINESVVKTLDALHNRNTALTQKWQQYVMTSVNNLALLLAESLEQMKQQAQSQSSKSCKGGKCKKPGKGKPSASSMKQMQEQLNKRIEELKKQLENGQKPGQNGQKSMSEQLARLAAEQEAIRKMLQEYGEDQKKEGVGNDGEISEMMKKMEQTETDLVNKMLNNETLKRQQEILTRLLESEKAEKERELDEKRKSNEAIEKNYSNPNQFFEYNKLKSKELELLKTIPVTLTPFFKYKTNEYFYKFEDR